VNPKTIKTFLDEALTGGSSEPWKKVDGDLKLNQSVNKQEL
jgi:hypothetical protein